MSRALSVAGAAVVATMASGLHAQDLSGLGGLGSTTPAKHRQYVEFTAEPAQVRAGTPALLELHFRVAEGFHINSHRPKSEIYIPTTLTLGGNGIKLGAFEYSAGQPYVIHGLDDETLDVYTGAFTVKVPLTVTPGSHELTGELEYQACDRAACYPPRTLSISEPVSTR